MVTQDTLGTNKNAIKQWSSNCLFYPLKETIPFVPVSHLFWGVWGLLQVELSPVGFGFAVNKRNTLISNERIRDFILGVWKGSSWIILQKQKAS